MKGKNLRIKLLFFVAGAIGGFLYWKFVGCAAGICPIKSVWYLSTLWGAVMGYLLGDLTESFMVMQKAKNE